MLDRHTIMYSCVSVVKGCDGPLGMENSTIANSQITVSSTLEDLDIYHGRFARLDARPIKGVSAGAWFAALEDPAPFIEVNVTHSHKTHRVTRTVLRFRPRIQANKHVTNQ